MAKTSVKKNLYYEIKDKVFEERFDGIRVSRTTQKVKVYGVDSTRDVRARLIELLYERVAYHKDKFIAPIICNEMKQMEVKKNGKVEHSVNSHDDQVFSYLMAIYVWYEGQNLMERYGILKNTLKTDELEEIETIDFENREAPNATLDLVKVTRDEDIKEFTNPLEMDIDKLIEKSKRQVLYSRFENIQFEEDQRALVELLNSNPAAREAYARKNNLDLDDKSLGGLVNDVSDGTIPSTFFIQMNSDDDDVTFNKYAGNLGKEFSHMFNDDDSSNWL